MSQRRSGPPHWTPAERRVLVTTVLGSSLAFIDGTVVNIALPAIQRDFEAAVTEVLWVVNAYALALAALILAGGALGDLYGRRKAYMLGVLVFTAASAWCGLAGSMGSLVVARALQGVGAALLVPGSLALIGAIVAPERRGRAIGTWSAATSIVTVLGPVLGGALVDFASWRLVFLVNVPIALLVIWFLKGVPESRDERARRPDVPGAVLAAAALGALSFGFIRAAEDGWTNAALSAALLGVTLGVFFVVWEARAREPMLPLQLFHNPVFRATNLLTLLLYGALSAALFFLPLNLIQVQGYGATAAGAALLPLSLLLAAFARAAGGAADRLGPRPFLVAGPIIAGVGFALLALPGVGGSYWTTFFPGVALLGVGMALTVAPLTSAVLGSVASERAGLASGVNNAAARTAGLLAVALGGLLLLSVFRPALDGHLARSGVPRDVRETVLARSERLAEVNLPESVSEEQRRAARHAAKLAFVDGFRWLAAACSLLAVSGGMLMLGATRDDTVDG